MNSFVERFNRTIQEEFVDVKEVDPYNDIEGFNKELMKYLMFYNTQRIHNSIGNIVPLLFISVFLYNKKSNMLWTNTTKKLKINIIIHRSKTWKRLIIQIKEGEMGRNVKNIKPNTEKLKGFTQKQIDEHFDVLYKGYVNKINEIEEKLKTASPAEANATYSNFRALKTEEVFTENAIRLHEGYFETLSAGSKPSGTIETLLIEDFGSYEKWSEEFKGLGLAARGWVVLAFDLETGRLKNFITDYHSIGVWNTIPLLILDVYEHAYFIDYGTARKKYIESYFSNINWDTVNARIKKFKIEEFRKILKG